MTQITKLMRICSRFCKHQITTHRNISGTDIKNIFSNDSKLSFQKKLSAGLYSSTARVVKMKDDAGKASVLIPLCTVDGEPSMLFMVRPMTMPHHRGEVCFPGGKADDGDHDHIHTALREAHEEIGLPDDKIDIWGTLGSVPSRKDGALQVVPVIGHCGEVDLNALVLNEDEAEVVFTRTIKSLCSNAHSTQFRQHLNSSRGYTLPVYCGGSHRIWGLTAIFVHQVLTLLIPELYTFKLMHR